jgi:Tol biopolymer transport system component
VAVDGTPWNTRFNKAVLSPVFSPDGRKVAAVVKDNNKWTVAVDGSTWSDTFDNVWDPMFNAGGDTVIAKAEKNGTFFIVVDGKIGKRKYESLWNPVFSPDGEKLLIRCIDKGKYYRRIIPLTEI